MTYLTENIETLVLTVNTDEETYAKDDHRIEIPISDVNQYNLLEIKETQRLKKRLNSNENFLITTKSTPIYVIEFNKNAISDEDLTILTDHKNEVYHVALNTADSSDGIYISKPYVIIEKDTISLHSKDLKQKGEA